MLGKLFGKSKPKPKSDQPKSLSPAIRSSVLEVVGAKGIPAMPGAAQKAFQLSTDPKAEARDFIEVIESDEALSSRVLKIANSVYFDRGKKSTTIEESVLVIGINELRCLLNATTLSELFPSKHPGRAQLWAHDIGVALIARQMAQQLIPAQAEIAFLGGLMHDIGKLLLLQRNPDEYGKVLTILEREEIDFCGAEEKIFPFDHCEVGQLIAERWNFTTELSTIISRHHETCDSAEPSLTAIVKAADIVAHALALGHSKGMHRLKNIAEQQLDSVWTMLGVPASDQANKLATWKRNFNSEFDLYIGNVSSQVQ